MPQSQISWDPLAFGSDSTETRRRLQRKLRGHKEYTIPFRDFSDPEIVAEAERKLRASIPTLEKQLEEIKKSKHVSRKLLDLEITI